MIQQPRTYPSWKSERWPQQEFRRGPLSPSLYAEAEAVVPFEAEAEGRRATAHGASLSPVLSTVSVRLNSETGGPNVFVNPENAYFDQ